MIIPGEILNFGDYMVEKQGVIERELYSEKSIGEISGIINGFMDHIYMHPGDKYICFERMFNRTVKISYEPEWKNGVNGMIGRYEIVICRKLNKENYLDVKYTLAHELTHLIHQLLSKKERQDDVDSKEQLRRLLMRISDDNFRNGGKSGRLLTLLYLIDREEAQAWNNNAYINAFRLKKESVLGDKEIMSEVLDMVGLSDKSLADAVYDLTGNPNSFIYVISFLIGNFFELGKSGFQQFFDESIFHIPVVKKMRNEMKMITYNEPDIDVISENTLDLVRKYKSELETYRDKITGSFIRHLEYWFNISRKRICKAIGIGIDDAEIKLD